jgi:drug/metabolite transporter (DMT)-like permease
MPGPIQLNRLMRRYWRFAASAAAVLGVLAIVAAAGAASMPLAEHDHGAGHGKSAVVTCVAVGGCALVVAAAVVAVRRLVQRGVWSLSAPLMPAVSSVAAPRRFQARAGPPPLLQVFRL